LQTACVASYTARFASSLALAITTSFVQVILACPLNPKRADSHSKNLKIL